MEHKGLEAEEFAMSIQTKKTAPRQTRSKFWLFVEQLPGAQRLKNMSIGVRLVIGFGILVILTFAVVAFSYVGSIPATETINDTGDVRVPTALASARAQANLLRMLGDVRGYLALGQEDFRDNYLQARQSFENNLAELNRLSPNLNAENKARLAELETVFAEWQQWPDRLFELRDDQLDREPAYQILATDGILLGGTVLIETNQMIEAQGRREASPENIAQLAAMAKFQGTFAAMLSGLRGYVTTRNRIFKSEYEANLAANEFAWEEILSARESLTPGQQTNLDKIAENRNAFLELPDQMFDILEGDRYREDLFLFRTETVPRTEKMQQLLADLTVDQQTLLLSELNRGRVGLQLANRQTLAGGIIALLAGVILTIIFRENIAGPVRRLTGIAEEIRKGDLEAQAAVEASDEIGTLAATFNSMTGQLRQTLFQVRKEKKRADDLLNVVIPIGVELSSEKDFNRLLENMLVEAKTFCRANGGALYLRRTGEDSLRFVILRNSAKEVSLGGTTGKEIPFSPVPLKNSQGEANHQNIVANVALTGTSQNIAQTTQATQFDFSPITDKLGNQVDHLQATSMLILPLKNSQGEVLGVLQLLDAHDPETGQVIAFDQNLQQMMESFSSLAAAALEAYIREQSLRQEIKQLRIEIDETKRQQQVSEIVDTDFFSDLQARAQEIRRRGRRSRKSKPSESEPDSDSE